jgi:hypothetical protein
MFSYIIPIQKTRESKRPGDSSSEVWFQLQSGVLTEARSEFEFSLYSAQLVVDIFSDGFVRLAVINRITYPETGDQMVNINPFHFSLYWCLSLSELQHFIPKQKIV